MYRLPFWTLGALKSTTLISVRFFLRDPASMPLPSAPLSPPPVSSMATAYLGAPPRNLNPAKSTSASRIITAPIMTGVLAIKPPPPPCFPAPPLSPDPSAPPPPPPPAESDRLSPDLSAMRAPSSDNGRNLPHSAMDPYRQSMRPACIQPRHRPGTTPNPSPAAAASVRNPPRAGPPPPASP